METIKTIGLGQQEFLYKKVKKLLPEVTYEYLECFSKNLTDSEYKYLLALCYNNQPIVLKQKLEIFAQNAEKK